MSLAGSQLSAMGSVLTGAQSSGGGGGGGPGTIQVDATPGLFGDGSPGAKLSQTAADPTHNGYMTLAQAAELANLFGIDSWLAGLWQTMKSLTPTINRTKRLNPMSQTIDTGITAGSIASTTRVEGGAIFVPAAQTTFLGQPFTQLIKTRAWAVGVEASFNAPRTGVITQFSVGLSDATNRIIFITDYDGAVIGSAANRTTNLYCGFGGSGTGSDQYFDTGLAPAGESHKMIIASNILNLFWNIDTVTVKTLAFPLPRLLDGQGLFQYRATASADLELSDGLYGYVSPT